MERYARGTRAGEGDGYGAVRESCEVGADVRGCEGGGEEQKEEEEEGGHARDCLRRVWNEAECCKVGDYCIEGRIETPQGGGRRRGRGGRRWDWRSGDELSLWSSASAIVVVLSL